MQLNDFLKAGGPRTRKALEQHLGDIEILPLPTCNGAGCYFAKSMHRYRNLHRWKGISI